MDKNLKIALILSATDKASAVLNKAFNNAERQAKSLARTGESIGRIGDKAMIAGAAITAAFGETVHMAEDAQKEANKLNAAFANVGKRGAEIAEQGKKFAEAYQLKIGVKDDEIEAAETKLAVFHNLFTKNAIQAQIFQRATKAAFDMQALGFGEASGNAQKLGKFLNDPINNLNAMGKMLGKISPAQKAHIANLYAQNKLTEAQGYALDLVEKKFRNAAERTATASSKMGVALHQAGVKIGNALLPVYTSLVNKFIAIVPRITAFIDRHQKLIKYMAIGGIGLLAFAGSMKILAFGISGVTTAYKAAIFFGKLFGANLASQEGIAAAAAVGYDRIKFALFGIRYAMKFAVIPALQQAGAAILEFGAVLLASPITWYIAAALALAAVVYVVIRNWDKIWAFFQRLGARIVEWGKKIGRFFSSLGETLTRPFRNALNYIEGLWPKFKQAGKNMIISLAKGIWDVAMAPLRAVGWIINKIAGLLHLPKLFTDPVKIQQQSRISQIITSDFSKPLFRASQANALRASAIPISRNAPNHSTQIHYNPVINLSGSATEADGRQLSAQLRQQFDSLMKDHNHRTQRAGY